MGFLQDESGKQVGFIFKYSEDTDNPETAKARFAIEPVPVEKIVTI